MTKPGLGNPALRCLTNSEIIVEMETKDLCKDVEMVNRVSMTVSADGDLHAFVHWFRLLGAEGDVILDTYGGGASPWEQAAFLVGDRRSRVFLNDVIRVELIIRNGRIIFVL